MIFQTARLGPYKQVAMQDWFSQVVKTNQLVPSKGEKVQLVPSDGEKNQFVSWEGEKVQLVSWESFHLFPLFRCNSYCNQLVTPRKRWHWCFLFRVILVLLEFSDFGLKYLFHMFSRLSMPFASAGWMVTTYMTSLMARWVNPFQS